MKKNIIAAISVMTVSTMLLMGGVVVAEETTAAAIEPQAALEEAQEAYRSAKEADNVTQYEQELAQMVTDGLLTQEQADLLLKAATDEQALHDGTCPNCGYEFSYRGRKGMNRGMRMDNGNHHRK